jgi:hypothetical protein
LKGFACEERFEYAPETLPPVYLHAVDSGAVGEEMVVVVMWHPPVREGEKVEVVLFR